MRPTLLSLTALAGLASAAPQTATKASSACTVTYSAIPAATYVNLMNPGWNLGNTLDAVPDEGSWNNPKVVAETFADIKKAGFKSVRIPVTYADHFTGSAPDWTVNPAWLQRVSDVVDMATNAGLMVVTNVHHDSTKWANPQSTSNYTALEQQFSALWKQIAATLVCKPPSVSFESLNEPPSDTAAEAAEVNRLNQLFLDQVQASGGFNRNRVVHLAGPGMSAYKTGQYFKKPANITNPWILQFHMYNPYDLNFNAWGKTVWGTDADKALIREELGVVRNNFTDVPLVIGEYSSSPSAVERSASWKWTDNLQRIAREMGIATMYWDNGLDNFDRNRHTWRDPTFLDILLNAVAGKNNSLPDSTIDPAVVNQTSAAFIFHKVGDPVADYPVSYLLNGNTFAGVKTWNGSALAQGTDYTVSGSSLVFKTAFLSKYISASATPGSKLNLTVSFSSGAPLWLEVVQWDVPTIKTTSSKADPSKDLTIPIEYKGLRKVATVQILRNDSSILFDDWTQWLPASQKGRGTLGNQYSHDLTNIYISKAAVQAVVTAGQPTSFTFEFYPRRPDNVVTYILNP